MLGTIHPMSGTTLHRFAQLSRPPDIRLKHESSIGALDNRQSKTTPSSSLGAALGTAKEAMLCSGVFPRTGSFVPGFT